LPFLAAGAMAMSSVTVVSNSLLLGRYKPKFTIKKYEREDIHPTKDLGESCVCKSLVTSKHIFLLKTYGQSFNQSPTLSHTPDWLTRVIAGKQLINLIY
jgi:hypothetical protein